MITLIPVTDMSASDSFRAHSERSTVDAPLLGLHYVPYDQDRRPRVASD